MNLILRLLTCTAMLWASVAEAESVFVRAPYDEVGNGWLFGSRSDGACWIALPWHVIGEMGSRDSGSFTFKDQSGRAGETGTPIRVSVVPAALEAAGGVEDLAFAPVVAGRASGECTSRLGLPAVSYVDALNKSGLLNLTYVQETSLVTFSVERHRAKTDDTRGGMFLVRPVNSADRAFLQGGLSGAVALLDWEGNALPAAMVLEVLEGSEMAAVVRFDRIRAAFEVIEAAQRPENPSDRQDTGPGKIPIKVTRLLATAIQGSAMLSDLAPGDCWRATPPAGQRVVEFVFRMKEAAMVSGVRLRADPGCGPAAVLLVEINHGLGWKTLSTSCPLGLELKTCRIRAMGPFDLRFRVRPPQGVIGISEISLF